MALLKTKRTFVGSRAVRTLGALTLGAGMTLGGLSLAWAGEEDARARIHSQISDSERRKLASIWVENHGNQEDLVDVSNQLYSSWLTRVH